ncbi:MAG: aminopeptidase [Negativicutes bacterium]|nr:aminopeptidase [Negativicutes bacterium]
MGVKPGESVVIVTDEPTAAIGRALWQAAKEAGGEAVYMEMIPRANDGAEPPEPVAAAMLQADVVLAATSRSLSHTDARKEASRAGTRIASLPGVTADMLCRTLAADYRKMAQASRQFADILTAGSQAELITPAGTKLTMSLAGRKGGPDTGINLEPGSFSNLPAGEAYIAPLEETAEGILVIDGAMSGVGVVGTPIRMTVEKGFVTRIEGGPEAAKLEALLAAHGKLAYNIAELGIGTNDQAQITGNVLEDEKVKGTVHIAVGNNTGFGGVVHVPVHLDGILIRPTLIIDGQMVIKDGEHLV